MEFKLCSYMKLCVKVIVFIVNITVCFNRAIYININKYLQLLEAELKYKSAYCDRM